MIFNIIFQNPVPNLAVKTEDDDELFLNGPKLQLRMKTSQPIAGATDARRSVYDNAFEDDYDTEMASVDGVSDAANNDNSLDSLPNASSNSFVSTFRRRMSSGLVLSYNFLKGASSKRRDST